MKTVNKICTLIGMALCIAMVNGCKKEDMAIASNNPGTASTLSEEGRPPYTASMMVKMTGYSPGKYGAVNVDIEGIEVHYLNEKIGNRGWIRFRRLPKIYDVLQYQNGASAILAESVSLPVGDISEVRVTFGKRNSVVWGDSDGRHAFSMEASPNVTTVSAFAHLTKGMWSYITLNFNASASVSYEGKDIYILSPVITVKHGIEVSPLNPDANPL